MYYKYLDLHHSATAPHSLFLLMAVTDSPLSLDLGLQGYLDDPKPVRYVHYNRPLFASSTVIGLPIIPARPFVTHESMVKLLLRCRRV
ncbi:hypothetical protein AFLA_005713 [Aspergillus flavus NRRL3357]|nr:hypothetical protein AFLA_005713 [Aspergillus flavus NRRL3357]